jgi:hypothetical protein
VLIRPHFTRSNSPWLTRPRRIAEIAPKRRPRVVQANHASGCRSPAALARHDVWQGIEYGNKPQCVHAKAKQRPGRPGFSQRIVNNVVRLVEKQLFDVVVCVFTESNLAHVRALLGMVFHQSHYCRLTPTAQDRKRAWFAVCIRLR